MNETKNAIFWYRGVGDTMSLLLSSVLRHEDENSLQRETGIEVCLYLLLFLKMFSTGGFPWGVERRAWWQAAATWESSARAAKISQLILHFFLFLWCSLPGKTDSKHGQLLLSTTISPVQALESNRAT